MSWLGKILLVMVMLMALAWMWFTVSVYAARTNWKNQSDMYKKGFEEAKEVREKEYRIYRSEVDALTRQVSTEQTNSAGLVKRLAEADRVKDENAKQIASLTAIIKDGDVKAVELQASYQATQDELKKVRDRSTDLENGKVELVRQKEQAEKLKLEAEILARRSEAERRLAEQRVEDLSAQVNDLKSSGGSATATVLNSINKPPPPLPEGVRGTVSAAKDGYVELTIGIDAGLSVGSVLQLERSDEGLFLGTVTVLKVEPKRAVAQFRPADPRKTLKQLRPVEFPKYGDTVTAPGPGASLTAR